MTVSESEINLLRTFGFKLRGKNRFSKSDEIQTITFNEIDGFFQLEVDGRRIYGSKLSFDDVIKIITILFPNESRKGVRATDSKNVYGS